MAVNYLILLLTTRCNLACAYCCHGDQEPADLEPAVLEKTFEILARDQEPLHIQLTGGEPLLVPHLIEEIAQKARKLPRASRLSLQTNATLLDRPLVKLLQKYRIDLGISLDGPPAVNDLLRGRSRELFRGLACLEEAGCPFTATAAVSRENCRYLPQTALVLAQYSMAIGLGLDLLVNKGRCLASPPERADLIAGAGRLVQVLDQINLRRLSPLLLREREYLRQAASEGRPHFCEACRRRSLAVTPLGRMYPCGQTAFREEFSLGTVFDQNWREAAWPERVLFSEKCRACFLKGRCPGECPSRLYFNESKNPDLACDLYRTLA
ncbi:MAG: radical SAM protein [Deltaproteobacteria bacterium]|jgi:uncharacterized protein|nr:radical SAM protein [Deltaproteobacteria bacterium]